MKSVLSLGPFALSQCNAIETEQLSGTHLAAWNYLGEHGPATAQDVADHLGMTYHVGFNILSWLYVRGYAIRATKRYGLKASTWAAATPEGAGIPVSIGVTVGEYA